MTEENSFIRAILASPEDGSARLVYADWLEERGDRRAEYLRIDAEAERLSSQGKADSVLQRRLSELETVLDPTWLALMTSLGRPFRAGGFQYCEPAQLPFTEPIGMRGNIVTFKSQFRGDHREPGLLTDLPLLCQTDWGECFYGASSFPLQPFLCELTPKRGPLTGADVLRALRARDFRSRHIPDPNATRIAYPGYHPSDGNGIDNDEIHNDYSGQVLFQRSDDNVNPDDYEFSGTHGLLKESVVDGQMWYVLLHITPEQIGEFLYSRYVILFAVGRSLNGDHLLGVVTQQVCHNLCD